MSQLVLDWVENALRAERQSLNQLFQERHQNMMQALALELEGVKWPLSMMPPITESNLSDPNVSIDALANHPAPITLTPSLPRLEAPQDLIDFDAAVNDDDSTANKRKRTKEEPDQEHKAHASREWVRCILTSSSFETVVALVILANSTLMGVEAQMEIEGRDLSVFHVLEHVFLACYTIELCLWLFGHGCSILYQNGWVAFDCVLVVVGIFGTYIVGPIVDNLNDSSDESLRNALAGLLVLRIVRLFKIARILRLLVVFKVLWMLVRGLLHSAATIAYTMGLILVIVYMFACMSIELVTKKQRDSPDERVAELVAESFNDLPVTMLSLLQFVSIDSIASLYVPLVKADPLLILFFLPLILIVSVSLMNVITAVIVEGAIERGKEDREATARYRQHKFQLMRKTLVEWFMDMDQDGNSVLTRDELESAPEEIKLELQDYMQSDSLTELFEMLDVDDSGEVDIDEFIDGMSNLVCSECPVGLIRVLKQLKLIRDHLDEVHPRSKHVASGHLNRSHSLGWRMHSRMSQNLSAV